MPSNIEFVKDDNDFVDGGYAPIPAYTWDEEDEAGVSGLFSAALFAFSGFLVGLLATYIF